MVELGGAQSLVSFVPAHCFHFSLYGTFLTHDIRKILRIEEQPEAAYPIRNGLSPFMGGCFFSLPCTMYDCVHFHIKSMFEEHTTTKNIENLDGSSFMHCGGKPII